MPYADPREAKRRRAERYRADPEKFRERARRQYAANPDPAKERAKAARADRRRERETGAAEAARLLRATIPEPVPYVGDSAATDWHARAACVGMDPELFFARFVGVEALAACLGCPVRAECLGFALAFPVSHVDGLWGGVSQAGRTRLLRAEREGSA